jgi:hypothetical protein
VAGGGGAPAGGGGGGGTVCVPATITGFNVTASCSCPATLSTDFQSTCSTCKKPPTPCKTCTIEITDVQASGSPTLEYRYSYRKEESQAQWISSDWVTGTSHTFADIGECKSSIYEVRVEVRNACTTSPPATSQTITLGGKCCCYFELISTDQHPIKAVWHKKGQDKWEVWLDGWVDYNVCNDRIEVKAELYLGNENQHKTDTKTANGGNFAIEDLKIDSGIKSDNPPSDYKVKITLKNLDDSSCQEKVYWVDWVDVTSS